MNDDLLDYYDRCFDEDSGPYKDPMNRDLEERKCNNCNKTILARPGEGFCDSCADKREQCI